MILTKEVEVGINAHNFKHYESLGYNVRIINEKGKSIVKYGLKIIVKVDHLTKGSKVKVLTKCDDCGLERIKSYEKCRTPDLCHDCSEKRKRMSDEERAISKQKKKEYQSKYFKENKEILYEKKKVWYKENEEDQKEKRKKYIELNKEKIKANAKKYHKTYYEENKEEVLNYQKEYYKENGEKVKARIRTYNKENLDKFKERYQTDASYKIKKLLRNRVKQALKNNSKSAHTMELIGCSIEFLKEHLQKTALTNGYLDFDINNYDSNKYHIDHVIPCDAFNLQCSYHQKLCFNWSNLQILRAEENMIKSNKIILN
jgi:hypothetical protein